MARATSSTSSVPHEAISQDFSRSGDIPFFQLIWATAPEALRGRDDAVQALDKAYGSASG
jgi:hypothetical protein